MGSILIQLAKQLTKLQVIASASRSESQEWVQELGADHVVDHNAADLEAQVRRLAPNGVDYIFSAQTKGRMPLFETIIRPFGQIVAIDDESELDFMSLKGKAVSWHWEFMFARPLHGWDLRAQHELLAKVSMLVDHGQIRTTMTKHYTPINAEQLRRAHAEIESGHTVGKIVVSNPV